LASCCAPTLRRVELVTANQNSPKCFARMHLDQLLTNAIGRRSCQTASPDVLLTNFGIDEFGG
jgi:hypothetical protein